MNSELILRIKAIGISLKSWGIHIILAHKLLIIIIGLAGILFLPFNERHYRGYFARWPPDSKEATIATRLAAWNGLQYLILSERGYRANSPAAAFYPLWPAVIRAGSFLTRGDSFIVALLLTNLLSTGAILLLYRLVQQLYGKEAAKNSLVLLLVSPGAFFFSLPYTESLFLFLAVLFFWLLKGERYFWLAVVSFCLPLTRAVGIFIILPLAYFLWNQRKHWCYWFLLLAPAAGYATYLGIMYAFTGNALEGFAAQRFYPTAPSIRNAFDIPLLLKASFRIQSVDGMTDAMLDRGLFLFFLASLPVMYRLNKLWFVYSVVMGMVPAFTNLYMSYRRFAIICFPCFVAWALILQKHGTRWVFWYCVVVCLLFQAWAVMRFINFDWAG